MESQDKKKKKVTETLLNSAAVLESFITRDMVRFHKVRTGRGSDTPQPKLDLSRVLQHLYHILVIIRQCPLFQRLCLMP